MKVLDSVDAEIYGDRLAQYIGWLIDDVIRQMELGNTELELLVSDIYSLEQFVVNDTRDYQTIKYDIPAITNL